MKTLVIFILQCYFIGNVFCQNKLSFLVFGTLTEGQFKTYMRNSISVEYGNDPQKTDSILINNWATYFRTGFQTMVIELNKKDSLFISRNSDKISSKINQSNWKPRTGEAIFNLNTLEINWKGQSMIGDKLRFQTENFADTSCFKMIIYSVVEHANDSLILGYKCKRFSVTELLVDTIGNTKKREISIWATQNIIPALPVYSILWFRKKILPEWTPLFVQEEFLGPIYQTIFTKVMKVDGG
jgi:hypothetical protein